MSADIQEIVQITTNQLNQVFKEQDALTKKIDALRTSTKNDIQILAKHLKSMENKNSTNEEVVSPEMQKLLDEKITQTFEKMIENVKTGLESRIKEAFESSFEGLKCQMTEVQKRVEDVENNQKNEDLQSSLEESNKRLEALEIKFEQNNQEFLKIQDERICLIENNTSDLAKLSQNIEDAQKEIQEINKSGEKQRDEFLEMIENMKNNFNESSLKSMMMKEIEAFGFDEEIKQLKQQIEESNKRFENQQTTSAQKTEEIMTRIEENIKQLAKLECWIQEKSYEGAFNERIEAIRKEVMDLKETFEDNLEGFLERGEVENDINQIRNEFTSTMEKSKEEVAERTKEALIEIESKIKNSVQLSLEDVQQRNEMIQEEIKNSMEEAIKNCSGDIEDKVKMLSESQEKAIADIEEKLNDMEARFSEVGKLQDLVKTLQAQSVNFEEQLGLINQKSEEKVSQLKERVEGVEVKNNEALEKLSRNLEESIQSVTSQINASEDKLEELVKKYNETESNISEWKAANGMEKAIEEIREEIEVVKGTQNNMFGGFKRIEDDAREKEIEFNNLIESGMKKLEESASTIQANMEAEFLKMKEDMNLIADKLKQELSENDDAIRHDVQKIEVALVSEEKINQLLKRTEEISSESVNNVKTEMSEQIRSLRREVNDDNEANLIRMNSLEKQIGELNNDVQSEKTRNENNIALYEENINDVKTETNEKCKIMLKKLENMNSCIQTIVDKEVNSLNQNFEDRFQNFKTMVEEQLKSSRGSQQEIVDDGKLSDEESMNQIAAESTKTETAESETQFKEDFERLKSRYESYQSEIDSLKEEVEDIKKNYQTSFEDLKKENVQVSDKVTECERNTQAILQSIGEQEEKLRTLILSEEERENSSTLICSKRESIRSLDDELLGLEEKLKAYLTSELGKSVAEMEQRLEEDTDKKIENINEIVKEVKSLLVTFGRDRVFQDENTMRNFVMEVAQKVTEDILKKKDEEEEEQQNSVQKCPFGFEEQSTTTSDKKAKYNFGSDPMMTSLWATIGLINERITGIETDLNAKTAGLRAVSTPY